MTLVFVWWNARGIGNKETQFKGFLGDEGAIYGGISEPMTYKQGRELSDGVYRWDAGTECGPTETGGKPYGGRGAFIDKTKTKSSIIRSGKYTLWHRIELQGEHGHMVAGTGYFPKAQDTIGHAEANAELLSGLQHFLGLGSHVAFGGDLNAHLGANGDLCDIDNAGRMLLATAKATGMEIVNMMDDKCTGGPSRVQVRLEDIQQSTIDYVLCSRSLCPHIASLRIDDRQMGSDHKPLVLTLNGLPPIKPKREMAREVWDISDIPLPDIRPEMGGDWSWIRACQARFTDWIKQTSDVVNAVTAVGADTAKVADMFEWSFQCALDQLAAEHLGTKIRSATPPPTLDIATRMAVEQRQVCENIMKQMMKDVTAPEEAKYKARQNFLAASKQARRAATRCKQVDELRIFRDVEANQRNSKLFWSKFGKVRGSIATDKTPPPVVINSKGETVTDPISVLCAWREFCVSISSSDLTDTAEEGIYDEDYKVEEEARLKWLRSVRVHQPELDYPITSEEVFRAIRRLKMGKSPGEDGILTDILKTAADGVNNSKLRGQNTVVEAIALLFNYIFDNEVWPERWGSGIISPLHKHDSHLDPGNYRPITLMSCMGKLFGAIVNERLSKFSEATGSLSDEQGGFRPNRGTPDQVFILREILASRNERGLATYASYLDVRKAYDTVWRERAYTRIHDSGVKGKLWRQLQAMHSKISRKVKHPLGMTEEFDVDRGVAQGAVESPWVYSNFIDGLTSALKAAGHGIVIAGKRVPCLMYADDVVMLASNQLELMAMNKVATEFARKNRFQFNGSKSGIMMFGVTNAARQLATSAKWRLSGSVVKVVDSYVYLGTITEGSGLGWTHHLVAAIKKARRRSTDLLWVCRTDRGMRSRTAVTLWQAMVRPLLEYASELWWGQVPAYLVEEAESVQLTFLRGTLGLHANGGGVSNEVVRAETGCERLQDRWSKLQLGYWRKVFSCEQGRLLRAVAEHRHAECVLSGGHGWGSKGWMIGARNTLIRYGLERYWLLPTLARETHRLGWRQLVYDAVDKASDEVRNTRLATLSSARDYVEIKEWSKNTEAYSFSSGENGRLCQHVPERYLDDRSDLKGTRLKLLCRTGCLPVMDRVGRELKPPWPKGDRICYVCNTGAVEDVKHFTMDCPKYTQKRNTLISRVANILQCSSGTVSGDEFTCMPSNAKSQILLGKRIGDPKTEDQIDRLTKRFLTKAWNARFPVTTAINRVMGTNYGVFSKTS
jgi:hypothetical protein